MVKIPKFSELTDVNKLKEMGSDLAKKAKDMNVGEMVNKAKSNVEGMISPDKKADESHSNVNKDPMANALENAAIFESATSTDEEKQKALETLKSLAPSLKGHNHFKHFMWKNKTIHDLFED